MSHEALLISACLLGEPCRYDGKAQPCEEAKALAGQYELVPVCPEQLGGLPTPRTPSEIQHDGRVVDGARAALAIARERGCKRAVLKSRSPSCGVHEVYDGSFKGVVIPGRGIAADMLANAGLDVVDEFDVQRK